MAQSQTLNTRLAYTTATEIAEAFNHYVAVGLTPLWWEPTMKDIEAGKGKGPAIFGWPSLDFTAPPPGNTITNIGVKLGCEITTGPLKGHFLVCVDVDDPGVQELADARLPPTDMQGGKKSTPRSHKYYAVDAKPNSFTWSGTRQDGVRGVILELLGCDKAGSPGKQAMVAPSTHFKSGSRCVWWSGDPSRGHEVPLPGLPGVCTTLALYEACRDLATAVSASLSSGKGSPPAWTPRPAPAAVREAERLSGMTNSYEPSQQVRAERELSPADVERLIDDAASRAHALEAGERQYGLNRITFVTSSVLSGGNAPDAAFIRLRDSLIEAADGMPPPEVNLRVWITTVDRALQEGRKSPRCRAGLRKYPLTAQGLADLLVDEWRDHYRWVIKWNTWIRWNGLIWEEVPNKEHVLRDMVHVLRWAQSEALKSEDKAFRADATKFYFRAENGEATSKAENLLHAEFAKGAGLGIPQTLLDTDPWTFACANGYYDMRSGEISPPRREDLITKSSPFRYVPGSRCPKWRRHVYWVFKPTKTPAEPKQEGAEALPEPESPAETADEPDYEAILNVNPQQPVDVPPENFPAESIAMTAYLLSWLGYCLTGSSQEQKILVLYGDGQNGKSAILDSLYAVSGDYGYPLSREVLIRTSALANTKNTDELADLEGRRWGSFAESEPTDFLSEGRIKSLTGTEIIKATRKYGRSATFTMQTTLMLDTNYRPRIQGNDFGILRRVKLLPFINVIPQERKVMDWAKKIVRTEGDAILTAVLNEAHKYYLRGELAPEPEHVKLACREFADDNDAIGTFITDVCEVVPPTSPDYANTVCPASVLYSSYDQWAKASGFRPFNMKGFRSLMVAQKFTQVRAKNGMIWRGITIRGLQFTSTAKPETEEIAVPATPNKV
jgi:P4 family phage/plasmid primase-like protien